MAPWPGLARRSRDGRHERHFERIYSPLSTGRYGLVLLAITTAVLKIRPLPPATPPSEISKIYFLYTEKYSQKSVTLAVARLRDPALQIRSNERGPLRIIVLRRLEFSLEIEHVSRVRVI